MEAKTSSPSCVSFTRKKKLQTRKAGFFFFFNTQCSQDSAASSDKSETITVRRLVSHVNPFRIKAPAVVGVSTSYPTSDHVRPRLVHSQELGADLVLQTPAFRLILAAALPSFTQQFCFLHMRERRRLDLSSAHSANKVPLNVHPEIEGVSY